MAIFQCKKTKKNVWWILLFDLIIITNTVVDPFCFFFLQEAEKRLICMQCGAPA